MLTRARSRFLVRAVAAAIALSSRAVLAQPAIQCGAEDEKIVAQLASDAQVWRQQEFDAFRQRLVNADLAGQTQASAPFAITGGLSDDKTTAKIQVGKGFAGSGTVALLGSLASPSARSIDLSDPLKAATDYSTKVSVGWSHWKNVLSKSTLRQRVCSTGIRTAARSDVVLEKPLVLGMSYEIGRTTFAFADPSNDYLEASERHKAQALNLTGGYVLAHGSSTDTKRPISTLLATYQRRWAHTAGSDTTEFVCHPVPNSTASKCGTTPLPSAPPVPKPSDLAQLDVRHFFSWPIAPGFRFTRNFTAGFNTYEAPVYFISKDDDKGRFSFTGGVTAGYRDGGSSKGRFVALFFGTTARPEAKADAAR